MRPIAMLTSNSNSSRSRRHRPIGIWPSRPIDPAPKATNRRCLTVSTRTDLRDVKSFGPTPSEHRNGNEILHGTNWWIENRSIVSRAQQISTTSLPLTGTISFLSRVRECSQCSIAGLGSGYEVQSTFGRIGGLRKALQTRANADRGLRNGRLGEGRLVGDDRWR